MTLNTVKPLYLVATPGGEALENILILQNFLSQRFQMYNPPYPNLHVTVGILEETCGDYRRLLPALEDITLRYLPLTVQIDGNRCFDTPFLTVGVSVTSPQLARMAGEIEGSIVAAGAKARSFADWHFHINLINPLYAKRTWSKGEFTTACRMIGDNAPNIKCVLDRLEIWHPDFPPLKVLAEFKP